MAIRKKTKIEIKKYIAPKPIDPFQNVSGDTFIIDDNSIDKFNKPQKDWDGKDVNTGPWYDQELFKIGDYKVTLG